MSSPTPDLSAFERDQKQILELQAKALLQKERLEKVRLRRQQQFEAIGRFIDICPTMRNEAVPDTQKAG